MMFSTDSRSRRVHDPVTVPLILLSVALVCYLMLWAVGAAMLWVGCCMNVGFIISRNIQNVTNTRSSSFQ